MHLERLREAGLVTRERTRQAADGRGTCGRSPPTRSPAATRRAPTPTSGAGSPASIAAGQDHAARRSRRRARDRPRARARRRAALRRGEDARRARRRSASSPSASSSRAGRLDLPAVQLPLPRRRAREPARRVHAASRYHARPARRDRPTTELTGFVPRDPYTAGCLIELRGPLAEEAVATPPKASRHDRRKRSASTRRAPRAAAARGRSGPMKRDPALVSLSHDHHQALFVAQALRRANAGTASRRSRRVPRVLEQARPRTHFRLEEEILLPAYAGYGDCRHPLVARVLCDHIAIRALADALISTRRPTRPSCTSSEPPRQPVRLEERQAFSRSSRPRSPPPASPPWPPRSSTPRAGAQPRGSAGLPGRVAAGDIPGPAGEPASLHRTVVKMAWRWCRRGRPAHASRFAGSLFDAQPTSHLPPSPVCRPSTGSPRRPALAPRPSRAPVVATPVRPDRPHNRAARTLRDGVGTLLGVFLAATLVMVTAVSLWGAWTACGYLCR